MLACIGTFIPSVLFPADLVALIEVAARRTAKTEDSNFIRITTALWGLLLVRSIRRDKNYCNV